MKVHYIKCLPCWFKAAWNRRKMFELRRDDRGYEVGDLLIVCEWSDGHYTGMSVMRRIAYILRAAEAPTGALGEDWCVLGLDEWMGDPAGGEDD